MIGTLRSNTRFDLHLHTDRSDGRYPLQEVLKRCSEGGLDVVAITDHDLETQAVGVHTFGDRRLTVLGGAEISGMHEGREYHLLVYFPGDVPDGFRVFCAAQCRERAGRYQRAVQRLGLSAELEEPDADARNGRRALTRLHLARALVETGHARDNADAFARFLGDSHGNVPALTLPMTEAIRIARSFGGITSWAHPSVKDVERHLSTFVTAGLQGLEGLRPYLTSRDRQAYRKAARRYGLFLTGGSDWHGWSGDDPGLFRLEARELGPFLDALQAA